MAPLHFPAKWFTIGSDIYERLGLPMIRLIATDLDDTLLDAASSLTPRTRRALL